MRCLAKDGAARFPNHAALRDALLPFGSMAPSPAVLGLRFVAGMIDEFITYTPSFALLLWTGRDAIEKLSAERTFVAAIFAIGFLLWDLLYYAVPEGLWGASIGKAICGLRVVGPNRSHPGLARALVRSLIFRTTWSIPLLATLLIYTGAEYLARVNAAHWNPEDWFWFPLLALLFCTMRRRNGFAGLHDLASGTRVIARPAAEQRPRLGPVSTFAPLPSSRTRIGPYEVLGSLGLVGAGELLLAHDPALRRNVWIHRQPSGTRPVTARRRDLSRASRLRWLNGHRDGETAWDAYEAPDGAPLLKVPAQSWSVVRFWLHDLAVEYAAGSKHESLPPALGMNRVWITNDNRAVVLDFSCPDVEQEKAPPVLATADAEGFAAAQRFLDAVARYALHPCESPAKPPAPLHAQPFLRSLADGRFESAEILVGNLQSLLGKMAEVSRRRRLAVIGLAASPAIVIAFSVAAMLWFGNKRTARTWPGQFPESAELRAELLAYDTFRDHPAIGTTELGQNATEEEAMKQFRRAFRVHFAGHHRALIEDSNFWTHPVVAETLTAEHRRIATEALMEYPAVSTRKLEEADATLRLLRPVIRAADSNVPEWAALSGFWALLLFAAVLDLGCVLLLGEGLFLRLLGVAAVNRDGLRASRLRLIGRTLLAWSLCFVGAPLSMALWLAWLPGFQTGAPSLVLGLGILTVLLLASVAWAAWRPARGLSDLACGTWLVPR